MDCYYLFYLQQVKKVLLIMASNLYHTPSIAPASEKLVTEISDDLGLQIPESELKDYVGE